MRRLFLILLSGIFLLVLPSSAQVALRQIPEQNIEIIAKKIILNHLRPDQKRVGRLIFAGGWTLTSANPNWGGVSAMMRVGQEFFLISDAGGVTEFPFDEQNLSTQGRIREIPKGCGAHWIKSDQDTESLAQDPLTGEYWIGREWSNSICKFDTSLRTTTKERMIPEMRMWPRTGGVEAMVRLQDGRFLAFAERAVLADDPLTPVLLFSGDPTKNTVRAMLLKYRAPAGYRPVDAAQLPDGRVLVLNRRFALPFSFTTKLVIIDLAEVNNIATLKGQEVAHFAPPLVSDNFEALAIENTKDGPMIWIASDDNFLFLQKTLLLKFRLAE
ncbi:MAG: esterase-like activity of phytase family protein [Chakrabartia sp.]